MVLKEVEEQAAIDKYQKAGLSAEKQMAFYLKRAFGSDENVLVINSLRLEKLDDAAQIDHLILHEYGMVVIESKSVTTKVAVNEYGEWAREVEGNAQGMASPVKQAQRQADFLKNYLIPFADVLLKKVMGVQLKFEKMPIDIVVAISDQGIIKRTKNDSDELQYVRKADQVVDKVKEIIAAYDKEAATLRLSLSLPYILGKTARKNTSLFLLKRHKPYKVLATDQKEKKTIKVPPKVKPVANQSVSVNWPRCGKCKGQNVQVAYGKYGYYIKCNECDQNTAIKEFCPTCKEKSRIRKDKNLFYLECAPCKSSKLYHKNL